MIVTWYLSRVVSRAEGASLITSDQMLIVSPSTATALASHAAGSWVMFVQTNPPTGGAGPIKIEGVQGTQIAGRLTALARDNAFETTLIGLLSTETPDELATAIADQYGGGELHDGWFTPSANLLAFVQHAAQVAIQDLLARTHPGALPVTPVDIDEMARLLSCSVPTVRRMVKAGEIPHLRWGRVLRFVPADVISTLHRRGR